MSRLVSALTALVLITTAPALGGCAAVLPVIAQVASVIAEIAGWVDLVEAKAAESGALPADLQARLTAVRAAVQRINDAARDTPAAYAAAVAEFERLYADLTRVVAPLGVRAQPLAGRLAAGPPGTVTVPNAGELGARLREAGAR